MDGFERDSSMEAPGLDDPGQQGPARRREVRAQALARAVRWLAGVASGNTRGGGAFGGEDDRLPSGHTHVVASLGSQVKKSSKQTLRAGTQGEGGSGPGEVGNVI